MNYNFSEYTYPSRDGKHTIYAEIYTPKLRSAKGIVQLAHGMIDYVGRYKNLAEYLTGEGYILAGNHHLGHGRSASTSEELGYFADKDGVTMLIKDMHTFNRYLRGLFPTLPLFILGHSMGSFITRLFVEQYPHSMRGAIIHGTSGPNPLIPFASAIASTVGFFMGSRHRSELLKKLTLGPYNNKFPKSEGEFAWLTRKIDEVEGRADDKYTSYTFTVGGYRDLFRMLRDCNRDSWFSGYPKELPTLIMSGSMDPVGAYGKGPDYVYKHLLIAGCKSVQLKMYEGARHELFNETEECRAEVFADIVGWLEGIK